VFAGKKRMGAENVEGNGWFVFQYFVFVFLCPYQLSKVVSGACWWCVQLSLGVSNIFCSDIWVEQIVGCWLQLL